MSRPQFQWLGRIGYAEGLALQTELADKRHAGAIADTILLLEHDPVYTIGRTQDRSSLTHCGDPLPHPVVEINRGGQATYHGPGQLVGYLILDLQSYGQDLHRYLRGIEEMLLRFLVSLGLEPRRREGLTGVWMENRKIASIGIGVRRWISMHGFGLNVSRDLSGYQSIVPCGIEGVEMTSLVLETGDERWTPQLTAEALVPFIEQELQSLRSVR